MTAPAGRAIVAAALLALGACATQIVPHAGPPDEHPFFRGLRPPLVIAHRGGAALWPENTLVAFRGAAMLGADVIELDLRATADGELVVLHDTTVQRTTDGVGLVEAMRLRDVRDLDAGYAWTPDRGRTFPYREKGLTVPTLAEVLVGLPQTHLLIEIKPASEAIAMDVCRHLRVLGASERVMVSSTQSAVIESFRGFCPEVATGATPKEVMLFAAETALPPPQATALAFRIPENSRTVPVLTPGVLAAAHERDLQVHVWTVNDPNEMRRLLAMGIDGIVTDRPDTLLGLLGRTRR